MSTTEFNSRLDQMSSLLHSFAYNLTKNVEDARDLFQETAYRALTNKEKFRPGTNFKAWLFTILRNTYFSETRKRRREVSVDDDAIHARLSVHPEQQGAADLSDFKKALLELGDDQREALILVGAEGFSYEEAAEIAGCAIGTVKSRVNRARARLSEILDVKDGADYGPDSASVAAIVAPYRN